MTTYLGGPTDDEIHGGSGNDILQGMGGNDRLFGETGHDFIAGGAGDDHMEGGPGEDYLLADEGIDTADGGADRDLIETIWAGNTIEGGSGTNDRVRLNFRNAPAPLNLDLRGGDGPRMVGPVSLSGIETFEDVFGTAGADVFVTGGGIPLEKLHAEGGDDQVIVDSQAGITPEVFGGAGDDLVDLRAAMAGTGHGDEGDDHLLGGEGSNSLFGEAGNDLLESGSGTDALWGGDGDDVIIAGAGQKVVRGDFGADVVYFGPWFGTDDRAQGDGVSGLGWVGDDSLLDELVLQGHYDMTLRHWLQADTFPPVAGPGLSGFETLRLLSGSDASWGDTTGQNYHYRFVIGTERVAPSAGIMTVEASGLGANESVQVDASGVVESTFIFRGGAGADVFRGGYGDDIFYAGAGADHVDGNSGTDTVRYDVPGATGLTAALFAPQLNTGHAAGDTYEDVEVLALTDGNDFGYGSNSGDTLHGLGGRDALYGQDGNDSVYGGDDHDLLWGGLGSDFLDGGDGFDYVRYDDATFPGMTVALFAPELNTGAAEGDTYANIEGLILGFFDDVGYGSNSGDYLYGINGRDSLYGQDGDDNVFGGDDHDLLWGGLGADFLDGGDGFDYARYDDATFPGLTASLLDPSINTGAAAGDTYASIDGLILGFFDDTGHGSDNGDYVYGINGNDTLWGHDGQDLLYGGTGDDVLAGGLGVDHLTGEAGGDAFRFDTVPGAGNIDTIADFGDGLDRIELDNAVFSAFSGPGAVGANHFRSGEGATAQDADDFLIYDTGTGALYYDADGSGAAMAVPFAILNGTPALGAGDFLVT